MRKDISRSEGCASLDGFTLHAATRAGALDVEGREALLRYVLRPPVAKERLETRPDGLVRITLKRAYSDGTIAVDMDPLSLLCRLATSVPPPRFHTVKYSGVLAPACPWRARIAPEPPEPAEPEKAEPVDKPKRGPSSYRPWAELLMRTFGIDVLECPKCKGRMRLIAMVTEPKAITRYLASVGELVDVPTRSPSRGPPSGRASCCARRRSATRGRPTLHVPAALTRTARRRGARDAENGCGALRVGAKMARRAPPNAAERAPMAIALRRRRRVRLAFRASFRLRSHGWPRPGWTPGGPVLYVYSVAVASKKGKPTPAAAPPPRPKRQWRDYRTDAGGRPVKDFIDHLDDEGAASVAAAMRDVRDHGVAAAKHLRGEVYEVVADTKDFWIRILFAQLGRYSQVLLSLNAFAKKTNKTPAQEIDLAETRLAGWKARGQKRKRTAKKP